MKKYMYNYVLVCVARTWERVRLSTEHEEMPLDNIESIDAIVEIADDIYKDSVIQGFIKASNKVREDDYWIKNTKTGMSDWYIEELAEEIITKNYL